MGNHSPSGAADETKRAADPRLCFVFISDSRLVDEAQLELVAFTLLTFGANLI